MNISVKKIAFSEQQPIRSEDKVINENYLRLLEGVQVNCLVRLGTLEMSIGELRQLKSGQTLSLNQKTCEPVDIVLNQQVIARGEIMCCEENFAIQITEVCA